MKTRRFMAFGVGLCAVVSVAATAEADVMGTGFVYQGQLKQSGVPVSGSADLQFALWDDPNSTGPSHQMGSTLTMSNQDVDGGLFTVTLDFGDGVFNGQARWLEIAVRIPHDPNDVAPFTLLSPRQTVRPAPHALVLPGLRTQQNEHIPNVIGGAVGNDVVAGAIGGAIGGGGPADPNDLSTGSLVTDDYCTIAGGLANQAGDDDPNSDTASAYAATIGGGEVNTASGRWATVSGGGFNTGRADSSTIGGGWQNYASDQGCTVAGGMWNQAGDNSLPDTDIQGATVSGGTLNAATAPTAPTATVGGGTVNTASGESATVPGGMDNTAAGQYSFAAGRHARADHDGAFVWADSTTAGDFPSTGNDQFLIRASGGVGIGTNVPSGFRLAVLGTAAKPGGGSWSVYSDARLKQKVRPLRRALQKLLSLQGVTFEYKDPRHKLGLPGRQMGVIAQQVETVFPQWVGHDQEGYKVVTVHGFEALVAEAVRELREEKDAELNALRNRVSRLEAMLIGRPGASRH